LATPQLSALARREVLLRGPSAETIETYRLAFYDIFSVTSDLAWVFVLALVGMVVAWKRGGRADEGIVSLVVASYALWIGYGVVFRWHPGAEPATVFHLVRLSLGLAAGVGGFHIACWVADRLKEHGSGERLGQALARVLGRAKEPAAFAALTIFLLPNAAPFVWRPLHRDPFYYESTKPLETHVQRLEAWLLANTSAEETVLTGEATGEWIAALAGRRVLAAPGALPRRQLNRHQRRLNTLFKRKDVPAMREALNAADVTVLVWDKELNEIYWDFDERRLETSGLFEKKQQILDHYAIYRVR
jgi:hypothetical protein